MQVRDDVRGDLKQAKLMLNNRCSAKKCTQFNVKMHIKIVSISNIVIITMRIFFDEHKIFLQAVQ